MSVMEANRDIFIHGKVDSDGNIEIPGCIRNGVNEKAANQIYDEMISFAKYAFNKSHSAAYSLVAVQTAYLKHYYPEEYMANLISSVMDSSSKLYLYVNESKSLGIEVLPPDVNKSLAEFTVEEGKIIFGLSGIKNVGVNTIKSIVASRKKDGSFIDFDDFLQRIYEFDSRSLNKKAVESLIKAGTFDSLGHNRASLMAHYEKAMDAVHENRKVNVKGQIDMFGGLTNNKEKKTKTKYDNIKEYNKKTKLKLEKEVLGFYISDHPLSEFKDVLNREVNFSTDYKDNMNDIQIQRLDRKYVTMAGVITEKSEIMTKKGQLMSFASLEDMYGTIEIIIFPDTYKKYRTLLDEDSTVLVRGNLQTDERDVKLITSEFVDFEKINLKTLYLKTQFLRYNDIKDLLLQHKGNTPVIIYFEDKNKSVKLDKRLWFDINEKNIKVLEEFLGKENVKIN